MPDENNSSTTNQGMKRPNAVVYLHTPTQEEREKPTVKEGILKEPEQNKNHYIMEFATKDYELVHSEIMRIKSCRANIFVGTIGMMGAVGVAILRIQGTSAGERWLYCAALIPVALITVAILSTIHKARNVTMRIGYMEALSEYLSKGKIPTYYCGWLKASFVIRRCDILSGKGHKGKECDKLKGFNCLELAKVKAGDHIKNIKPIPDLLDNFTSLSLCVYGLIYIIAIGSLLLAISFAGNAKPNFSMMYFRIYIASGIVFAGILWWIGWNAPPFGKKYSSLKSYLNYVHKSISYLVVIFVSILFIMIILAEMNPKHFVNISYYLAGLICITAGIKLFFFYSQVAALRKGRYSIERWRHIWKICFEYCELLKAPTVIE